ncbi:UNVERIFIED_CONTAM: hypothetical protein PYX00_002401 [Menopon gallinae]|uniref:Evolutionarily conserved signaling intermediate in Toll pathway, mitochondrial n=1 Tax=Menopon gallinae TaxID=328185 RepID=A0AAW2IGW5_9NEOP
MSAIYYDCEVLPVKLQKRSYFNGEEFPLQAPVATISSNTLLKRFKDSKSHKFSTPIISTTRFVRLAVLLKKQTPRRLLEGIESGMRTVRVIRCVHRYTLGAGFVKCCQRPSIEAASIQRSASSMSICRLDLHDNTGNRNVPRRLYSTPNKEKNVMNFFEFAEVPNKNKETFNEMIAIYDVKYPNRKGVVDFIYSALKYMKEFGVMDDLDTYKKLINLMPKGKYIPQNKIQAMFTHFPREQFCIAEVLFHMQHNAVIPDVELGEILINIFGSESVPTKKYYKMMYWYPKMKNLSPWPVPTQLPDDTFALALMAIERITSPDLQTKISVFRTENVESSIDKTWIISGQSPTQRKLLQAHNTQSPVIVEGGEHVWLRKKRITYFVLKSEESYIEVKPPIPVHEVESFKGRYLNLDFKDEFAERSPHEQDDGIIYAVCATGTSGKDSLLSWIRLLQENGNPVLKDLAVLFKFKKPPADPVPVSEPEESRVVNSE